MRGLPAVYDYTAQKLELKLAHELIVENWPTEARRLAHETWRWKLADRSKNYKPCAETAQESSDYELGVETSPQKQKISPRNLARRLAHRSYDEDEPS
jgi:hypothetical protein